MSIAPYLTHLRSIVAAANAKKEELEAEITKLSAPITAERDDLARLIAHIEIAIECSESKTLVNFNSLTEERPHDDH
jgi:hypothetical protein